MREGQLSGASFAAVADVQVLNLLQTGLERRAISSLASVSEL